MSPATGGTLTLTQRDRRFGYLLTAPGLAVLVVVVTFPLFFTIFTSFYDYTLLTPNHDTFIGGENYQEAAEEEYLPGSLWVTVKFVLASVVIEFIIGFVVALSLNATTRFKTVYYLILLAPLLINPGGGRAALAHAAPFRARHRQLRHRPRRHQAGQLARRPRDRVLDRGADRHLAPGLVHGDPAACRPLGPAARALRSGAHGRRVAAALLHLHHPAADAAGHRRRPAAAHDLRDQDLRHRLHHDQGRPRHRDRSHQLFHLSRRVLRPRHRTRVGDGGGAAHHRRAADGVPVSATCGR